LNVLSEGVDGLRMQLISVGEQHFMDHDLVELTVCDQGGHIVSDDFFDLVQLADGFVGINLPDDCIHHAGLVFNNVLQQTFLGAKMVTDQSDIDICR